MVNGCSSSTSRYVTSKLAAALCPDPEQRHVVGDVVEPLEKCRVANGVLVLDDYRGDLVDRLIGVEVPLVAATCVVAIERAQ